MGMGVLVHVEKVDQALVSKASSPENPPWCKVQGSSNIQDIQTHELRDFAQKARYFPELFMASSELICYP